MPSVRSNVVKGMRRLALPGPERFTGHWWAVTLRGVVAILFGVVAVSSATSGIRVLLLLFGVYAFLYGGLALTGAISPGEEDRRLPRGFLIFEGLISVAAGVAAIANPGMSLLVLSIVIGMWAFATGVLEVATAIRLGRHMDRRWLLLFGGACSAAFGVFAIINPWMAAVVVARVFGIYNLVFGVVLVGAGLELRRLHRRAAERARQELLA